MAKKTMKFDVQPSEELSLEEIQKREQIKKDIAKVNKESFVSLMETIDMTTVVSPKDITASNIVRYIRARNNTRGNNIVTLHKLVNNQVEAIEFIAKAKGRSLNKPLKDLKLKPKVLIAGIIRRGESIIPNGLDMIVPDDRVIVVTNGQYLDDLDDILV